MNKEDNKKNRIKKTSKKSKINSKTKKISRKMKNNFRIRTEEQIINGKLSNSLKKLSSSS